MLGRRRAPALIRKPGDLPDVVVLHAVGMCRVVEETRVTTMDFNPLARSFLHVSRHAETAAFALLWDT